MSKLPSHCRWGILSTANIGRKNWLAIKNSGNGSVVAVASRKLATSQAFIDECQATEPFSIPPAAIEGYENLLTASDIDAVYVPLPTGLRKEYVIRAAESGKHVMCEKPCASNATDLREMIEACRRHGVQFMDGVMYMHTQRLQQMRTILDAGHHVGKIRRVASQFSFNGGDDFEAGNIRLNSNLEPLGALGDLGWYTIRFSLWAMNFELPTYVCGKMLRGQHRADSPATVPMEISGELFYADGVSATFYNSFITAHQQWANISGTLGQLHLQDFVLPFSISPARFYVTNSEFVTTGCEFKMLGNRQEFEVHESSDSAVDSQEANLFRKFADIVNSGNLEPHWPEISLKTQQVMDAVMQSAHGDGRPVAI